MVRTAPRPTAPAEDSPAHHAPTVNILAAVHVLSSWISRAFDARLAREFDVSPPEWRVLLTLAQRPGASANEITEAWAMEKMAVSRAVRRLERMGRICRRVDGADRRRYALDLTPAGRSLYRRILPVANARYREITGVLSHAERATLRRALAKLNRHIPSLAD
ncbi:MAG TPA: MarR family winged helix-turn-helix transcriptional regulator [Alphaproteobacteria bacterium]